MKVIRTYTLPNGEKVETLTDEQKGLISFDMSKGGFLYSLCEWAKEQEPMEHIVEIHTNYTGKIEIFGLKLQ